MITDILLPTNKTKDCIQPLIDEIEKNTPEEHRIIASCQPLSASKNRNYCLSYANSDIIVMMDDDICNFYPGWLADLLKPFEIKFKDSHVALVSARLMDNQGNKRPDMGMRHENWILDRKVTTACIAFYKTDLRFDEEFIGSGYEDNDFMIRYADDNYEKIFMIAENCKLIHNNEMKNQSGEYWEHNHAYFCKKYPDDEGARNQKCWVK